jgi:hypothetical protein
MPGTFDVSKARERFPALTQDQVFLDNAGGSQALGDVVDSYASSISFRGSLLIDPNQDYAISFQDKRPAWCLVPHGFHIEHKV